MTDPKPIFVLNGPNLNLLGHREPEIYGAATLADIEQSCRNRVAEYGLALDFRQTNAEGEMLNWLHEARDKACAVVLNPGGWTHTSVALHDAVKALSIPIVETHLSNPAARETFRHISYVAPVATGVIAGFGAQSYLLALDAVARLVRAQ